MVKRQSRREHAGILAIVLFGLLTYEPAFAVPEDASEPRPFYVLRNPHAGMEEGSPTAQVVADRKTPAERRQEELKSSRPKSLLLVAEVRNWFIAKSSELQDWSVNTYSEVTETIASWYRKIVKAVGHFLVGLALLYALGQIFPGLVRR